MGRREGEEGCDEGETVLEINIKQAVDVVDIFLGPETSSARSSDYHGCMRCGGLAAVVMWKLRPVVLSAGGHSSTLNVPHIFVEIVKLSNKKEHLSYHKEHTMGLIDGQTVTEYGS